MSGDVQPRKRKDKKKRKEDGEQIPEKPHVPVFSNNTLNNEDVNIHVHKEGGTGGGICAKLVFFILFSALAVLIGLIITEHRGLSDLETIDPNSKFSQLFEGWVDTNSHDDHDDHNIEEIEGDDHDEGHDEEHGDEDDHEDDDHDDHEDNEESEEVEHSEEEDEDDDEQLEDPIEDDDEDESEEAEDEDDDGIDEIDDDDEGEDPDTYEENETAEENETVEENDEDDDQDQYVDNVDDEQDNEDESEENDDQDDRDQDDEEEEAVEVSREKRGISEELDDEDDKDDVDHDDKYDDEADDKDDDKEDDKDDDKEDDKDDDTNDQDDKDDEEKLKNQVSNEKDEDNDADEPLTPEQARHGDDDDDKVVKEKENIKINVEKIEKGEEKVEESTLGSSSMAVKLGVGVALLVVAHLVLVKKWRNAEDDTLPTENPPPNLQDRRNTIIVPPAFKEVEPDIEQVQEDFTDEDEYDEEEEERPEINTAKAKYQELATAYTRPVSAEKEIDTKISHGAYEFEEDGDEQDEEEIEEEEEESEEDEEGEEGEEFDDEEADEVDDEDEELLKRLEARYGKLQKDNDGRTPEKRDSDSDGQSDDNDYEYTNITNENDYKIRKEIDEAQSSVKNNTSHAITLFDKILQKFPSSPRSLYGKALALDLLADKKRSNEILEKCLQLYVKVLKTDNVPTPLFDLVAERCINRMRFLGQYKNAIAVHKIIIDTFPNSPKHLNSLAVTYLTINRVEEARAVLKQILIKWPEDGFALVHYGFILKTSDNELEKAVRYLRKGIGTNDEGVIDGRFYFHLGDALVRLGRRDEAVKIYEEGTKNKVFFSKYQRSLYNVPRLSAKPWWKSEDLSYRNSLNLLTSSWKKIREEGLSILSEKGYFQDESENLRDTGEWKQFELYARGQKNVNNCKKCPFTCSIISKIPEAKNCRRGQTKFSVMHPGTHIWPHCGPTNCRLRVHLGLKVPSNTFIRVADDTKSWKEGELFIFDDSFEHEVWHNGTDFRLILIVDFWHPELTPSERNSLSPI